MTSNNLPAINLDNLRPTTLIALAAEYSRQAASEINEAHELHLDGDPGYRNAQETAGLLTEAAQALRLQLIAVQGELDADATLFLADAIMEVFAW